MIAAYLAGASTEQAAALFGHSGQTCTNILIRRGITPRSHEEVCRHYAVNESFFDYIDTEEKAYWLGFLTADGGIVGHQIVLGLKIGDLNHLYKFADSLNSNHPVTIIEQRGYSKGQPMGRIVINSVRMVKALVELGVGEKKSHTVRPCDYVPEWLLSAYWRGLFDGDGCITNSKSSKSYWEVSLVGNRAIVTGFRDFMDQFLNSSADIKPHKSIFRMRYSGLALPRKAVEVLYSGATIYLDRKYALARQLCEGFL